MTRQRETWKFIIGPMHTPLLNAHEQAALRDQFAAAALTGLLAADGKIATLNGIVWQTRAPNTVLDVAHVAYACADAMLTRRAQPTAPSTTQTAPSA